MNEVKVRGRTKTSLIKDYLDTLKNGGGFGQIDKTIRNCRDDFVKILLVSRRYGFSPLHVDVFIKHGVSPSAPSRMSDMRKMGFDIPDIKMAKKRDPRYKINLVC